MGEAAFLAHEREALREAHSAGLFCPECLAEQDPPPPPVSIPPMRRTCGPDCRRRHDGLCQVCGEHFNNHNGHYCEDGRRGTFLIDPEGDARAQRRWEEEEEEE